jgi:tRNA U34 5-carboxymethylaminomethyl modifying enzyme MnmG/GidA
MQIINFLFQNPNQRLIQRQQQAQAKVAQLNQQLGLVSKERDRSTAKLQPIKAKLHSELRFWESELKQAEATLAQPICSGVGCGLGDRLRQSGLPP